MSEKQQLSLLEIMKIIEQDIEGKVYSNRYICDIKRVYRYLREYADVNGIVNFSAAVGQQFLQTQYGLESVVKIPNSEIKRAINMISDYQLFGFVRKRTALKAICPEQFNEVFEGFLAEYQKRGLSEKTCIYMRKTLFRIFEHLDAQGVLTISNIKTEHLNEFIKANLCNYSTSVVSQNLYAMRCILKYLYTKGHHSSDFSNCLIKINKRKAVNKIPSAFKKEEVDRMLSCVDRNSPVGKRDYAILMLAAKLGIRAGDIMELKFEHINWNSKIIRFLQGKTGSPLELPLLEDVGWALIDYLKYGRPKTDISNIFVRQVPPHVELQALHHIVVKYLRIAKIPIPAGKLHGTHSLRHSLASTMLEQNIPITTIKEVLGHLNSSTTEIYTSVDMTQLVECALEVPYVEN